MHDAKGKPIKEGDVVLVPCQVIWALPNNEYCNTTLETLNPMYPGDTKSTIVVNASQVLLADQHQQSFIVPLFHWSDGGKIV